MDTYCRVSRWHCPRCSQQTHTLYLLTAVKRRRRRRKEKKSVCVYISVHTRSPSYCLVHTKDKNRIATKTTPVRDVRLRTTLFVLLQQQ
uniref:Uncharacterized protein n=1 Tax=Oryza brachyantha TaxID=4533 RepID=J3M0P8_ORYBR